MKKLNQTLTAFFCLCTLLIAASCAIAQDKSDDKEPTLDQWLTKLENKANQIKSLTATIRYDRINELLDSKEIRTGDFFYQAGPPRNFAAHFTFQLSNRRGEKIDKWWIYDGHWLVEKNITEKFFKRYEVNPPSDSDEKQTDVLELGQGPFAVPIDFNKASLLKKFKVELIEASEGGPKNTIHLRLIPKNKKEIEETYIDLWYDRDSLLPSMVETVNEDQETRSIFKLTKTKLNAKIDKDTFDTDPPKEKGWTIDQQSS
ncbi:outer membrane lipoprotein carrier protein LolA [Planctomycetota bacterium]|nr:outer membrane lipoprotein carrier protein LolA [Planctomycetota bacterium]